MKISVLGVGLIGGSIGLAAKRRLDAEVSGFDPEQANLERGLELGALDRVAATVAEAVDGAEVVFCAAPVGALPELVAEALAATGDATVVSDVGSTKRELIEGLAAAGDDSRFIGGHPLAGAETAGVEHARADLFQDATWYLTPTAATRGTAYEGLHRFITRLGAWPSAIDAETHDVVMASVSHLPHVLANVLVAQAARVLSAGGERLPATGPSFRDVTRVAGANSSMWGGIYRANADALVAAIDDLVARLVSARDMLAAGDDAGIVEWNEAARVDRRRLLEADLAGGEVHELRVLVPNRPGIVAEIALALGRATIDIVDMGLYPSSGSHGTVALWIRGGVVAEQAERLVRDLGLEVARA